jgi:hypothetical protein
VPDFISALERQDVNKPGTVAHVSLKVGGDMEPPTRVTLGAWPDGDLYKIDPARGDKAKRGMTMWEVPLFSIQDIKKIKDDSSGDSAVTLYWAEKELKPGATRVLGFAYGLGSMTGDSGKGTLGLTSGGELVAEKEFNLTAYVKDPVPNQTVSLSLPRGLVLVGGKEKEEVKAGSAGQFSTVSWRLKADRQGLYTVKLSSSTGASVEHRLPIKPAASVFHNKE